MGCVVLVQQQVCNTSCNVRVCTQQSLNLELEGGIESAKQSEIRYKKSSMR